MNQNVLGVDLENYYDKKEYSLKTMGASRYVRDARFNPYLISVSNGTDSWAGHPRDFNWSTLEGATLVSHNAGFDSRGYAEMVRRGVFPKVNFKEWLCTANLSVYLCMRRDLLRATEFLLGVSVDKSYREDADGKTWEDMVAAGVSEKVKEAGRSDALRCWQIWTKYGHLWPQMERELSQMTIDQCQRGCAMDTEELQKQILLTQSALIQADARLPWIAEGRAPTSPKAIAEKCREHGIPSPPVKKHEGEEAYDAWEATYSPRFPWVKAYSDHRVLNKHLSTLETIKERIYDGNIFPYELLYFGAHTGRWAGSGGFNMQNMRKNPLLLDLSGSLVTDPVQLKEVADAPATPSFVSSALDVRKLFVARAGYRLMAPDLSQIEPRVLAWLVKDQKMLDSMAAGNSPYQAHAISTMNWTGGDLKKENKGLYALAKARVLGLGFQCGWNKFITVAQVMAGLDITKDDPEWTEALNDEGEVCLDAEGKPIMVSGYGKLSRQIVKEYRQQNALIVGIWNKLDAAFKASVGGDFEISLPSGRSLRYAEVMIERKAVADPDHPGKWKIKRVHTALAFDQKRSAVVRKPFYGGLLTENLVQATARDIFGECVLALNRTPGLNVLWTVHDEAVIEAREDIPVSYVKECMSRTPAWMPGLPVACEVKVISHYEK